MIFGIPTIYVVGAVVFLLILGLMVGGIWYYNRGKMGRDPQAKLAKALNALRDDADALALLPYDDGMFHLKPANFDKELIGGQGGYETEDGDKIVLDGDGEPVKKLEGIDVLLAVDPTEHAGAVEPVKAHMAQKNNIGEWIKVDREGNLVDVGEALLPSPETADELEIGPEGTLVEDRAEELATLEGIRKEQAMERALEELEKESEVRKVFDLAPPAAPAMTDGGELVLDEATHIAVDQSKAADLMPTTTSTVELNTALDKARMEEYEEGKLMKYFTYGMFAGAVVAVLFGGIIAAMNAFL